MVTNINLIFKSFLQGLFFRTQLKDDGIVYYYNIRSGEQPLSAMCSIVSMMLYLNRTCVTLVFFYFF